MDTEIPFTVIGGYLGAGKTTLLNHILRHNEGRHFALLINDFGSINIDIELIESQDGDTINLANGCICCSLAAGFVVAINTLLEREPRPDHVIVEASGVSDPAKIAQYGQLPGFSPDGIIVVADAETVRAKARDKYVGQTVLRQLKSADLLILNKIDLVTLEQKQAVLDWLAQTAPQSRLIEAQYGVVPLQFLLGLETAQKIPALSETGRHAHHHDSEYETWSYVEDRPLSRPLFERFVAGLPESVIRAKGVLYLAEAPDRRMVFQMVGKRWNIIPDRLWGQEKPQSRIVWIGIKGQFEPEGISARLETCSP